MAFKRPRDPAFHAIMIFSSGACCCAPKVSRSAQLPDVPTLRESGINVSNTTTCGVFGPAGMAPELVRRLAAAALLAVQGLEPRDKLARYLFDPAPAGPQELAALMVDESREFARLVKLGGYGPE